VTSALRAQLCKDACGCGTADSAALTQVPCTAHSPWLRNLAWSDGGSSAIYNSIPRRSQRASPSPSQGERKHGTRQIASCLGPRVDWSILPPRHCDADRWEGNRRSSRAVRQNHRHQDWTVPHVSNLCVTRGSAISIVVVTIFAVSRLYSFA
jgi:hypothetical protein